MLTIDTAGTYWQTYNNIMVFLGLFFILLWTGDDKFFKLFVATLLSDEKFWYYFSFFSQSCYIIFTVHNPTIK